MRLLHRRGRRVDRGGRLGYNRGGRQVRRGCLITWGSPRPQHSERSATGPARPTPTTMKTLVTTVMLVAASLCAATYHNKCPPNFDLATLPAGENPARCLTTKDCPKGRLCCPALGTRTDVCLCPVDCDGPFPGGPQITARCPANFNLAAATFPVGESPTPCNSNRDCPSDKLCCPALSSQSDLCLAPVTGNGPFPSPAGQAPHMSQGSPKCPPPLNLAVVRFPAGLPINCKNASDCPRGQFCCPAINPFSNICRDPISGGSY